MPTTSAPTIAPPNEQAVVIAPTLDLAACIRCPACGFTARSSLYVPGELAAFVCRTCKIRYWIGLGPSPVLRAEPLAEAVPA